MTTKAIKRQYPGWLKSLAQSRLFGVGMKLFGVTADAAVDGFMLLAFGAVIGGALTVFGPYLLNIPEILGRAFAAWCVERGSCDLTTNLTSVALGVYLLATVVVLLVSMMNSGQETEKGSIYYDILRELESAGEPGITPVEIAKRTGHELSDVHTMLAYLYDDARTITLEGNETDRRVRYKYVSSQ